MATEATFPVPSDQFPLGSIFEQLPGVTVEIERIIPGRGEVIPYIWIRGAVVDDVEAGFSDHPGVKRSSSSIPSRISISYVSSG